MANNTVIGGKMHGKRGGRGGGGGGGGWRRGRGRGRWACGRRGNGSEDASDEDYVVGGDGEEEYQSSEVSYSTDASLEASEENACLEEEEGDEDDEGEYDPPIKGARRRRRRKEASDAGRGRRRAASSFVVADEEEVEEMEAPLMRKARALRRLRPTIPADDEGGECDEDEDDEDFAPEEDEDDEEEMGSAPLRRSSGERNSPVKLQRREARSRKSNLRKNGTKAPARKTKNRRRRVVETSDDDDLIVRDEGTSVVATYAKKKRKGVSRGRKRRRAPASRPDPSESDSSDFDYAISLEESRDLRVGRPPGNLVKGRPPSSAVQGDKGKGKDDGDLGKQVCGICLSQEKEGIVRGLLNCCAHYFCFVCIMEWSKVESRCPLCKRRFKTLCKLTSSDLSFSLKRTVISIPERDQVYQPCEEEIRGYLDPYANVVCIECLQGVDDNLLLLCDICDSPAHTYCVGLGSEVPEGNWYCNGCRCVEPGSSHSQLQESVFEHRVRNERAQVNLQNGIDLGNAAGHMPRERPHILLTLPCQHPSDEIGEVASSSYLSSVGDHETALRVPGFTASTVSGRRSLHQRIRTMVSINWMRWIPEEVSGDSVIRPTIIENNLSGYGTQHHGETLHAQQEGFTNGIDESSRSLLGSRVNVKEPVAR